MTIDIPAWNGDSAALHKLQSGLAGEVSLRDGFAKPLRSIAGLAVGFDDAGATIRAAAVLLDAGTLDILDQQIACLPTAMPDIPDLRSFRQLPALLAALEMLKTQPDLAFVDGHGIAHPRRFGIAAHFGVASGLPSIGVTGETLVGEGRIVLHDMRGAFTPLRDGREQIGWLLRSKPGCPPLIVSPGHRVAMASAPELVMRCVTTDRLPEPTRLADRITSRR
jgi:deoxyribonuclease V